MASPQLENGYTKIANELLEAIYSRKFSTSQLKILLIVVRYTYGFNRKSAQLSNNFISNGTGIHEITVSKEVNQLIFDKVLFEITPPTFNQPREISLNKNYDSWQNHIELVKTLTHSKKTLRVSENANTGVSKNTNTRVSENANQESKYIKQNINQNKKAALAKDFVPDEGDYFANWGE